MVDINEHDVYKVLDFEEWKSLVEIINEVYKDKGMKKLKDVKKPWSRAYWLWQDFWASEKIQRKLYRLVEEEYAEKKRRPLTPKEQEKRVKPIKYNFVPVYRKTKQGHKAQNEELHGLELAVAYI